MMATGHKVLICILKKEKEKEAGWTNEEDNWSNDAFSQLMSSVKQKVSSYSMHL